MGYKNVWATVIVISLLVVFMVSALVSADDATLIPENKEQLEEWFKTNVAPVAQRKGTLNHALEHAEATPPRVITVDKKGPGDFKTIKDALDSIDGKNTKRVIIRVGAGEYVEKITIPRHKHFVTLIGHPLHMPVISFDGNAAKYGTVDSATVIIYADYFMAVNIIFKNSAPMPDGKRKGAQALAIRISGNKAAFYNCKFYGFQDTLCDDRGHHFFKDCFIQGTYDFIFGSGTSLYLGTQLNLVGEGLRVITAHAGKSETDPSGYSFVHCNVTGTGHGAYLGRAWMTHPKVVYSYTMMTEVVNPAGWRKNEHATRDKTVFYGEYKCTGVGAHQGKRVDFTQEIDSNEAKRFLSLGYIHGSKWLLPPPSF